MSSDAKSSDSVGFYAASLEETFSISASAGVSANSHTKGPLRSGRWLVQLRTTNADDYVWVCLGKFTAGPITAGPGEGRARFPLSKQGMVAVEFMVKEGYNDELAFITESSAATLYLSRVSRDG